MIEGGAHFLQEDKGEQIAAEINALPRVGRTVPDRVRRVPAGRRRPRVGQLRAPPARAGRRGRDPARRARARSALQPAAAHEDVHARRGVARRHPVPAGRLVRGAAHRGDDAHERDEARPRRARRDALRTSRRSGSRRRCSRRARTCASCTSTARELDGIHYLRTMRNADALERGARGRGARRGDRRQLHRHRAGGLVHEARQAVRADHARVGHARALLRPGGRPLLPGRARASTA